MSATEDGEYSPQAGAPYGLFRRFLQSPSDMPCTAPPWGTLTAVDMTEGKIRWQVPLGSMQDFGGKQPPVPPGSINLGGPIVDRWRTGFHRRHFRPIPSRLRCRNRKRIVEGATAGQRPRDTDDLPPSRKWKTICGDRRRRPSQDPRRIPGRFPRSLYAALKQKDVWGRALSPVQPARAGLV